MKLREIIPYLLCIVLAFLLWQSCDNKKQGGTTVTVNTKEIKGTFIPNKPNQTPIVPKSIIQKSSSQKPSNIPQVQNDSINERLLKENEQIIADYKKANDSLKQVLFEKSIQVADFDKIVEDSAVKITMFGKVRGTIESLGLNYTIKPQKQTIRVKTYRVLAGAEIGSKQTLDQFSIKGNLMYQSSNGNLFSGSIENNKTIWIGFNKPIFSFSRTVK